MRDPVGWTFVIVICLVVPWMAYRSAAFLRASGLRPSLGQTLLSVALLQGVLVVLALWAAARAGVQIFGPVSFDGRGALLGAAVLVGALAINPIRWRFRTETEKRRVAWLGPQRASDAGAWLLIALVAGVAEEIIYRGALLGLLEPMLGGWWPAVGVCVAACAAAHWVQGWSAMLIIIGFAFCFHVLVRVTGDLYTAMAVHILYDFAVGWLLLWLARREFGTAAG